MTILLVEDDHELAASLIQALRTADLSVNRVATGGDALHVIQTEPPEIVVLDLGLPDLDGLDVLKKLRVTQPDLLVLLLTARDSVLDKVQGLDQGADDYLAKPFEMPELLARLRALSRRVSSASTHEISIGSVSLDTAANRVLLAGEELNLSRREFMLLRALMENTGKVQTREQLEQKLYGWGEEVASNALEVHVHNLRKKLGNDLIETVRGVGYTIRKQ